MEIDHMVSDQGAAANHPAPTLTRTSYLPIGKRSDLNLLGECVLRGSRGVLLRALLIGR